MDQEAFRKLLDAYQKGQASDEERELVETHFASYLKQERILPEPERVQQAKKRGWQKFMHEWDLPTRRPKNPFLKKYRIAAIAALLLVALATALYFYPGLIVNRNPPIVNQEIGPGGNRATLTLADGTEINLDSAKAGIQINDEDVKYNDGTNIEANSTVTRKPEIVNSTMLTLTTPKGGQYQIILSDGTKVWLNAATTLKYPSRFSGDNREVVLEGEGYFEIKEDKTKPFKVLSKNQEITVLGTSFNLTAYSDEDEKEQQKTTLISGAIQVASHAGPYTVKLAPGEQSTLQSSGKLTKAKADINSEIAWRRGLFRFNQEPLESVMRQVSRWYNVDVRFEDESLKTETIEGIVNRFSNLSTLLHLFEMAGDVQFTLQDHTLIIRKK